MLFDYILCNLRGVRYQVDGPRYPSHEATKLRIRGDKIHTHNTLRLHYTTYDVRRATDFIKSYLKFSSTKIQHQTDGNQNRSTIMLSAYDKDDNPKPNSFWYARVLGIFHVYARDIDGSSEDFKRIDILWVRWFGQDPDQQDRFGWKYKRTERVGFQEDDLEGMSPFGFVDPSDVVRAAHLIPAFAQRRTTELLQDSLAQDKEGDFAFYCVNR